MAVEITHLPDAEIVIAALRPPFDPHYEIHNLFRRIAYLRKSLATARPRTVIIDTSLLDVTQFSFRDLVFTLSEARMAARERDPNGALEFAFVGSGPLLDLAIQALPPTSYRRHGLRLLDTLDEALKLARAQRL